MTEKQTLLISILLALLPVLLLAALFPERLFYEPRKIERLYSVPGSDIVAFTQYECPHCRDFRKFAMQQGWSVEYIELSTREGRARFAQLRELAPSLTWSTPTIIVDGKIFQGYDADERTGKRLSEVFNNCRKASDGCRPFSIEHPAETGMKVADRMDEACDGATGECVKPAPKVAGRESQFATPFKESGIGDENQTITIWLLGDLDLNTLSLPMLSVVLGFLDGFNPCAMWVLVSLLTLLLTLNDLKKMLIVGGTFLFVSAFMYYLFIAAWLNVFLLIGYNFVVQKMIGLVAVGAGGFYLYEAFGKDPNACQVTGLEQRQRIIEKMKKIASHSAWIFILGGTAILAISVNMIELVCTAGLPAIFTQILATNQVSAVARYFYLLIYIILYMIDDLIIFAMAVYTMRATGMTTRYRRLTLIFGGGLMYSLGVLMIFFPDALVF